MKWRACIELKTYYLKMFGFQEVKPHPGKSSLTITFRELDGYEQVQKDNQENIKEIASGDDRIRNQ